LLLWNTESCSGAVCVELDNPQADRNAGHFFFIIETTNDDDSKKKNPLNIESPNEASKKWT